MFDIQDGVLVKYHGDDDNIIIPDGVVRIQRGAFSQSSIKTVIIPEGMKEIDSYAFSCASELEHVTFSSSLEKIGYRAFGSCKKLATDYLQISDTTIVDPDAFQGCCKRTYATREFDVEYNITGEVVQDSIEIEFYDDETLKDKIDSAVDNYIWMHGLLDDIVAEAIGQGYAEMNHEGIYEIDSVAAHIDEESHKYIEKKAKELSFCVIDDYTNNEPQVIQIDLLEKLKYKIENRDEAWDVDVGRAIESDIMDFALEGSWHFGFVSPEGITVLTEHFPELSKSNNTVIWRINGKELTPALWFGRENDLPMRRWMITPQTTTEDLEFWFFETGEEIMDSVVDDFDIISMWYLFECALDYPDIISIRKKCPISIEENDTQQTIQNKINSFFQSQYTVS